MARVLVGIDGSEFSRNATARALDLLGTAATEVTIARVVRTMAPVTALSMGSIAPATTVDHDLIDQSNQSLMREAERDVAAITCPAGVKATAEVVVGDPGPELCRLAADGAYDLLVVGSHGSGLLKRVLLGSVSHHVLHHAPCPVLVVRGTDTGAHTAGAEPHVREGVEL